MPYPINQDDIVQVTIEYEMPQVKRMLNVLHYRYSDTPQIANGHAAILTMLQHFGNAALTNSFHARWKVLSSETAFITAYWGQKVYPVRYGRVVYDVTQQGQQVEEPLPGLNQWGIIKRGDIAQRYAVGGIRVPGLGESQEAQGEIAVAARPAADLLAAVVAAPFVDTALHAWRPIVYRRGNPGSSVDVVESRVNYTISTQRTRIVFRGI